MTDNEIARKAWGMGRGRLTFHTGEEGIWTATKGSGIHRGEAFGMADSPRGAMLDYIKEAMLAATSREENHAN